MRILIDTNIIIEREDNHILSEGFQQLQRAISDVGAKVVVHPLSKEEICKDPDKDRQKISLSKINTYSVVEQPPTPIADEVFYKIVGPDKRNNDFVDNSLLYCIVKDAVDFLITEDKQIHVKAQRIGIRDRVFSISECFDYLEALSIKGSEKISIPLKETPTYNLDFNDTFFDSLKNDYSGFETWWKKISTEGRKALVYLDHENKIRSLLITKIETESIGNNPELPAKRRLKICTLKVVQYGSKVGELFLKIAFDIAWKNGVEEVYLTHFPEAEDFLIPLIE
jgi:hypothetical protein